MQNAVHYPSLIADWSKIIRETETPTEKVTNRLTDIMMTFATIRASLRAREMTDTAEIIYTLMAVDKELVEWAESLPSTWAYHEMPITTPTDHAFEDYYHVYPDIGCASQWNAYRCMRLMANDALVDELLRSLSVPSALHLTTTEILAQRFASMAVLHQISREVYASVPYCLGIFEPTFSDPKSTHHSAGGFFLLWPLVLSLNMNGANATTRRWGIQQLETIGETTGINCANVFARRAKLHHEQVLSDLKMSSNVASAAKLISATA
jgi:hypothetical protein